MSRLFLIIFIAPFIILDQKRKGVQKKQETVQNIKYKLQLDKLRDFHIQTGIIRCHLGYDDLGLVEENIAAGETDKKKVVTYTVHCLECLNDTKVLQKVSPLCFGSLTQRTGTTGQRREHYLVVSVKCYVAKELYGQ